jgi:hypothetical protein
LGEAGYRYRFFLLHPDKDMAFMMIDACGGCKPQQRLSGTEVAIYGNGIREPQRKAMGLRDRKGRMKIGI